MAGGLRPRLPTPNRRVPSAPSPKQPQPPIPCYCILFMSLVGYRYPGTFVRHVFPPTREVVCAKGLFHSDSCRSLRSSSHAPSLRRRHLRMSLTWLPRLSSSRHHRPASTRVGRLFLRPISARAC